MKNIVPILFTFDEKLVMPAGVCITSLLLNAAPDTFYDIFIIHSDRVDLSKTKIHELATIFDNCKITFRQIKGEFTGAYEIRGIPETAYYRLISPELIPEYDKILYSDVDVIFREDLWKFYSMDIGDNYFAAVDNCSSLRPSVQKYLSEELNLDYKNGYYYSGNLIINSKQILKDNMTALFRKLGKKEYFQQDMDIMNIACNKRIYPLSPSYCLTNYIYELMVTQRDNMNSIYGAAIVEDALKNGIVHYNGPKPWNSECLNMDIWWWYYRKSIFFDEQFCFNFFCERQHILERLSLKKRFKLLVRYFVYGKNK